MELSFITVILISAIASQRLVQAQFICTDTCDPNGSSQRIGSSPEDCCSSADVNGYYPLLVGASFEDCQPCLDASSLMPQIMTSFTPESITINRDATFTCDISSANPNIAVEAIIQWLGPNGTVLAESGPNANSLDLDFEPFELSDVGDYTCTAKVSSPDFPSNIMSVISRTITFTPPTNIPLSVSITQSQPPVAGEPYTLTCTITREGETIEWIDSDGNVISSGNGIVVGDTMSGGGTTTKTLTFNNLRSSDTGRYTCRNSVRDVTQRLITGFLPPEVTITQPTNPMFGTPYQPNCTATLPQDVQDGNLTVTWFGLDGSVLASVSTMDQSASVELPISSLEISDFGTYTCRAVLTSPFLDRSVFSSRTLTLGGSIQTPPPLSTTPTPPAVSTPSTASPQPPSTVSPVTSERVTTIKPTTSSPMSPVDECAMGLDNCSRRRRCSFSRQNGRRMIECIRFASCIDRDEGFECRCNPGFEGDGVTCRDINECARGTDNCHPEARCVNQPGGFDCRCRSGFIGDGTQCCIRKEDALRFMEPTEDETDETSGSKKSRGRRRHRTRSRRRTKSRKQTKKRTKSGTATQNNEQEPALDENCRAFAMAYNAEQQSNELTHTRSKSKKTRTRKSR